MPPPCSLTHPERKKKKSSVACSAAALAAALAAVPYGTAARAFQRSFLALWPARVCLALYAALLMASQPLALDLPARRISSSAAAAAAASRRPSMSPSSRLGSLTAWAAAGGACRLHSTLGCALPLLLFTAASMLAAPLSSTVSSVSSGGGKSDQNSNAPLSATATLAVAALAAAPAAAAQAALAWAPGVPVEPHPGGEHHSWRNAALGICEPGTGGSRAKTAPCGCRYSLARPWRRRPRSGRSCSRGRQGPPHRRRSTGGSRRG